MSPIFTSCNHNSHTFFGALCQFRNRGKCVTVFPLLRTQWKPTGWKWEKFRVVYKVKVRLKLSLCHEGVLGSGGVDPHTLLTSALDGDELSDWRPGRFTPRERARGTHGIGGWVGPRAVLHAMVKRKIPSPRRESNPRIPIVQPVAQHHTDWAIAALKEDVCDSKFIMSDQW
jgi:hypothetical protein